MVVMVEQGFDRGDSGSISLTVVVAQAIGCGVSGSIKPKGLFVVLVVEQGLGLAVVVA